MKVYELITELEKRNPESVIKTWDAYSDNETEEVYIWDISDTETMIASVDFGSTNAVDIRS